MLFLQVICSQLSLGLDAMTNDSSVVRKLLDVTTSLSRVFPTGCLMLFCMLAYIIALHLQAIRSAIEKLMIYSQPTNELLLDSQRWQLNFNLKRYYLRVSKTIDIVNHYFGVSLLAALVL